MFPHPNGETIVVHPYDPQAGKDSHGNVKPGFGPDRAVDNCGVDPNGASSEPNQRNRALRIDEYLIFGPADIELGPRDEVTVRGVRCTVEGDPNAGRARNIFSGWSPGCQFTVKRVAG